MINAEELAICRRRGHDTEVGLRNGWALCKWCGIWRRSIETVEEREDMPPEHEQNPLPGLRKKLEDQGGKAK